ncbi:MAG: hypothetical protein CVV63_02075 [Tenericutes bacterium HGW-Tenericutes-8]|nr:MAG: hypothetical protein CVV63_02075 [Tenericutes bacterium HGW-Tenericutes-8]
MQYLKNLMLSVDFINGSSKNDLLLSEQKEKYHRISIFAGQSFIFVYTYLGESFEVSLKDYKLKNMEAYWMNPQNGSMSYIETYKNVESLKLKPTKRHEDSNDWVLVLKERTSK